jgi:hypothetical protein
MFHGKLEASLLDVEDVVGGKGCSFAIRRRVSAATIPPIECPIRIVWTGGSTVGDGVACATTISIILFSSLDRSHLVSRPIRCYSSASAEVGREKKYTDHSLNLRTQSLSSPRVSNFGYVIATTSTFGSAWLMRARTWSGKVPKVSSPPYQERC